NNSAARSRRSSKNLLCHWRAVSGAPAFGVVTSTSGGTNRYCRPERRGTTHARVSAACSFNPSSSHSAASDAMRSAKDGSSAANEQRLKTKNQRTEAPNVAILWFVVLWFLGLWDAARYSPTRYSSTRYSADRVRRISAFPVTAGLDMNPSSNVFWASSTYSRPALTTVAVWLSSPK